MTDDHEGFRDWDAAYVLGALAPADRLSYERHLETCALCAAAVAELAGLPGILGRLPAADALAIGSDAASAGEQTVLGTVRHLGEPQLGDSAPSLRHLARAVRRRTRARVIGAIAAVALVGGATAGAVVALAPAAPAAVAMSVVGTPVMTADLRVVPTAWGTRLEWSCRYRAAGTRAAYGGPQSYDLVVVDRSGRRVTVASWTSTGAPADGLVATTAIAAAEIRSVEVTPSGSDTAILRENL
ncbi:anti-sigma factor family protein [Galbitalea soli]|uniref:Zf-HC2 domain-containing protein n=1 Tax=Galbitalea soli TaxID=1268042 RepID=A0A7C9PLN2_9MICO|nr:zf-HC2 domain-containing protein [Galbitalea soli]NEM90330.1 zf-HC2 domain-containing protein [Galbitalea soli]NYJ31038.1 hypothetical protein [Galbitalea soli]